MSTDRIITMEECAQHTTEASCWLCIDNKVYDVTKFLGDHPGGREPLRYASGKDATDEFNAINHTDQAKKIMLKHLIGTIHPKDARQVEATKKNDDNVVKAAAATKEPESVSITNILLLCAILALGYHLFA